ncbi:MAG: AbrB/MazE/SpoVT family DNA-binding domain-containing protein [Inquilinaceae bacterium]
MKVVRWGNSLAVCLPAAIVKALDLKEGDDVRVVVAKADTLKIQTRQESAALLATLRKYRGWLLADFVFDRPTTG